MSSFKVLSIIGLALVVSALLSNAESKVDMPEDGVKALFLIEKFVDSLKGSKPTGEALQSALDSVEVGSRGLFAELSNFHNQAILRQMLKDMIEASDSKCTEDSIGKVVVLEAKLEEGSEGESELEYKTKALTPYLEANHFRLLESCQNLASTQVPNLRAESDYQLVRKNLLDFVEYLRDKFEERRAKTSATSIWWTGGAALFGRPEWGKAKTPLDNEIIYLRRGKEFLQFEFQYSKIQDTVLSYFNADLSNQTACRQSIAKHEAVYGQIHDLAQSMNMLLNYNPVWYAQKIPAKAKKARKIFALNESIKPEYLNKNVEVKDFLALNAMLRQTIKRVKELCASVA